LRKTNFWWWTPFPFLYQTPPTLLSTPDGGMGRGSTTGGTCRTGSAPQTLVDASIFAFIVWWCSNLLLSPSAARDVEWRQGKGGKLSTSSEGNQDLDLILSCWLMPHAPKCATFYTVRHGCFDTNCILGILQKILWIFRNIASTIFKTMTKINLVASYTLPAMKNGKFEVTPLYYY